MDKSSEDFIAGQAKKFAQIVHFSAGEYDQLIKLEERLNKELQPYSDKNKIFFINIWKKELDNLFKNHLSICPNPDDCPQHRTSENAAFLFGQFESSPMFLNSSIENNMVGSFKDKYDLNYYFKAANIPNQSLVFETYNFFKKGEGKEYFEPLDFLNLLNWHYRFLVNNVDLPFSVLNQFLQLPLSKIEKHILIAFIIKWFGGYPVNNLNTQFNTTLKLLEQEYLDCVENNNREIQDKNNKLLAAENLTKDEEDLLQKLKSTGAFLSKLDSVINNKEERKSLQEIATKINDSFNPSNKNKMGVNKTVIFISHSSKDDKLVKLFVDKILQLTLKLDVNEIICTSIEACSILSGDDFRNFIKAHLKNASHVIQIITENYKKSEVCMNEMGAAWVLDNKIIPFIIDPVTYDNVGFIHQPNQLLKIDRKNDLLKFVDEMKTIIKTIPPFSEVERHIEDFLAQLIIL
jgi:hypothetical protein